MHKPSLKKHYQEQVVPELMKLLGYKNIHQVPTLSKIVINSGFDAAADKNWISDVTRDITLIAGQEAVVTKAKQSISNFKVRQGMPLGVKVTLRGNRMYELMERILIVALPNIRDFRGVSRKLDGRGNYTIGIVDHTIFPEVNVDTNRPNIGMDITIVTTANSDDEGRELLRLLGMPFRKSVSETAASNAQPSA